MQATGSRDGATGRLLSLDVLRCLAVLLVILRHAEGLIQSSDSWLRPLVEPVARIGWMGVDLFFVLSGFLVSGLLFRELDRTGTIRPGRFLIRRAFKILPSFWVYIAVVTLLAVWRTGRFPWKPLAAELLFVQNYFEGLAGQTWSLAVEEHSYWLLPFGLLALWDRASKKLCAAPLWVAFIVISAAALACRSWLAWTVEYQHITHLYPTHLRLDALLSGVMLGYWRRYHPLDYEAWTGRLGRWGYLLVALALAPSVSGSLERSPWVLSFGLVGNYFGFALLIALRLEAKTPTAGWRTTIQKALACGGRWSYCVYLWHLELIGRLGFYGIPYWPLEILLPFGIVGSFALGWLMTELVERPCLRLRDRWFPD